MQPEGIVLAVPTSAIFSQIYLQQVEQKQIINLLTNPKIVGYFRDVDDITVVFDNTNKVTQLQGIQQTRTKICLKLEMQ